MKTRIHLLALLIVSLSLFIHTAPARAAAADPAVEQTKHYVCPPCGCVADGVVYDKPGICPKCGMALVDADTLPAAGPARPKVAILIFDGVEIIDYSGPYEVFGAANFDVYTVAKTKDPVTTAMGLTVVPKYTFADAPQPEVLVVPGGGVKEARDSAETLKWVTETTVQAKHTMSVCNGAFILASAGLLDGLSATTTAHLVDKLRAEYPKTKVVDDKRFVDNGKIITTAGLSSGIDGALHVVALLAGDGNAHQVALQEEYDWRPRSSFARAALADMNVPEIDLSQVGNWETASTEGGTDRWKMVLRGTSQSSTSELSEWLGNALATKGHWTRVDGADSADTSAATSRWKFTGRDGKAWTGTLKIAAVAGGQHRYTAELTIGRQT